MRFIFPLIGVKCCCRRRWFFLSAHYVSGWYWCGFPELLHRRGQERRHWNHYQWIQWQMHTVSTSTDQPGKSGPAGSLCWRNVCGGDGKHSSDDGGRDEACNFCCIHRHRRRRMGGRHDPFNDSVTSVVKTKKAPVFSIVKNDIDVMANAYAENNARLHHSSEIA